MSDETNRIVGDLDRFTLYTYLNIMDRDLAANCPVIHTILKEQTVQLGCGMASKITKQDVRGCLSHAVLPWDCHNITCTL